jgi:hypothetical protein
MKRPVLHLGLATLLISAVIATGVHWLRTRERALQIEDARVRAEFDANRRLAAALRAQRAGENKPTPATTASSAAAPASANTAQPTNYSRAAETVARLRAMPEYARFIRRDVRRQTVRSYSELFAELRLAPDRLEALKSLLDDHAGTLQDLYRTAREQGLDTASAEISRLNKRYAEENNARVRELLGADDYARFERFEKAKGWRTNTQPEIDEFLAERNQPALSLEQRLVLCDAYLATVAAHANGKQPGDAATQLRALHAAISARAATTLTPAQHEALAGYFAFIEARSDLMVRLLHPEKPPGSLTMGRGSPPP